MADIDLKDYEAVDIDAIGASAFLTMMWERLGKPKDPISTESGRKLMEVIINVWIKENPEEYVIWQKVIAEHKNAELTTHEQVRKKTGRILADYPYMVFQIINGKNGKGIFPGFDPIDRENCKKMVKYFPLFKMVNTV